MLDKERKKRKLSAGEQAWQQRRAESLAAYNQREAEREERRAANTDDPERAAAARRAAEMYRSRIPAVDNGAAAPFAGRNPGGGNGVPVAGGNNADNAALKALTADVARLSAEVNRLRRIIGNLAGEGDLTPDSGFIEVDRSVPTHPVVRFRADRLPESNGGKEYIAGDDTNIVFTPVTDGDDAGKVKVDVYWKA